MIDWSRTRRGQTFHDGAWMTIETLSEYHIAGLCQDPIHLRARHSGGPNGKRI